MTSQCYRFIPRLRSRQIPFLSLLFPNNSVCTEVVLIKMYELPLCEWMRLFFTKSLTLSFSLALSGLRCIVVGTCVRSRLDKRGAVDTGACGSQTFSLLSETSQSKTMRASAIGSVHGGLPQQNARQPRISGSKYEHGSGHWQGCTRAITAALFLSLIY